MTLSWPSISATPQIQKFQVRYSSTNIGNAAWMNIPGSNHNTTSHTVTGLAAGTTYAFQVRAVNSDGNGANALRTAITLDPALHKPGSFSATGGFRKLDLSWTRAAASTPVDRYEYRLSTDGGDNWSPDWTDIPGSDHSTTRHTVTGLADETAYTVELRIRAGTVRTAAARTTATTDTPPPPDAPTGFTATGGFRKLDLSWTAAGPGVIVDRYQYRLSTDSGDSWSPEWTDIPGSGNSTTSHTVTGLPDATDYTVELRIRVGSVGSDAARSTATTNDLPSGFTGPPGAPTNLTVTLSHGCYTEMDWSAPASNGGSAITKYQFRRSFSNGSHGRWQSDLGNPLLRGINAFRTCGASYTYQVRAVNANGAGPRASITFTPLDDGPPNEPVDLIAVGGIQRVALSWKRPATTLNQVTYYQVRYRNDAHRETPWTSWTRITNSNYRTTRHTVTGLVHGAPYILEVRAVNSKGSGASAQQEATVQAEPAQAPTGFTATAGIRKVDLAWTAAASTVAVEAYQYRLSTDGGDNWNRWTDIAGSDGTTTRHTVSRLANGTAYTVELRIRAGTTRSNAVSRSATTPDVPSAPVLSAVPGTRSIMLTWTTPHEGGRAITRYQYRRTRNSPGFIPWTNIRGSGPNTTSYTHSSGLSDVGRRYTFEVRAVSAVGNGRAGSVDGRTAVSGDPTRPTIRTWFQMATEGRHAAVDFSVQLHPAASSTVTVDYRTEDRSATAPADYRATAGTLTFAPGETEKTLSVPIVDDTVEDSREKFWLLLSNVSGARLGVERTYGVIYNHEDVLAGFTLVDAAAGTDVGWLADGTEVTLDAPATGQYGVRVEPLPEAVIGSLRLELSGAKAATRTDNAAPYTLYSEGGEGLPQGAYTLRATAYPDLDGGGTALQTLSVSFTVTAKTGLPEISGTARVGETLTASVDGIEDEDGLDNATFAYQWMSNAGTDDTEIAGATNGTYEVASTDAGKTIKVRVTYTDDGGAEETLLSAATDPVAAASSALSEADAEASEGEDTTLEFVVTLDPATEGTVTVDYATADGAATAGEDYTATSGTLTFEAGETAKTVSVPVAADTEDDGGETLTLTLSNASGAGLGDAEATGTILDAGDAGVLSASFEDVPASHDGSAEFTFGVEFSEAPDVSYVVLRDDAFTVTGGSVKTASRAAPPSNLEWKITVEPDGDGEVTITLATTADCNASDAICTSGGLALSEVPAALTVPGPDADDGNDGGGTAVAVADLTASFSAMPGEHGGAGESNRFTFDLAFSENLELSYKTLRDHAFTVTGGDVKKARRKVQGSNRTWTITVEPDGWGDVSLTLPGGRACTASGAICTAGDRQLSNSPSATVQGPAALSVADASATEGSDATLDFAVSLDRASTLTVTVDYATADGTATAGADYTATSGMLTFDPGDVTKTVSVPVLDDVHDDGGETLTLTLSNASNARIGDGTATGTIENSDPIPQAWLARFGRTVADHVVDAIGERLKGSPGGGSQVTLGGQKIPLDGAEKGASADDAEAAGKARDALAAFADRASGGGAEDGTAWARLGVPGGEDAAKGREARGLSEREMLLGSSFLLAAGGDGANASSLAWAAWGRAAASRFDGNADGLSLDGDVTTFTLGADAARGRWLGGVALAHSTGAGGYRDHAEGDHASRGSGELESTLTSVHPYLRFEVSERFSTWGILGYGTGDLTLTVDAAGDDPRRTWKTDTSMWMAAAGARGVIVSAEDTGGFELAARGDARLVRMSSDAAMGADGAGPLRAAEAETNRLRFVLEGSHRIELSGGQTLRPSLEVGLRHDGGDAETGTGIEVGGGIAWADPALGLTVSAKARGLVAHRESDYTEWGASGSVRVDPGASGRGLSLTLSPAWGADSGNAERLWGLADARGLAANDDVEPAGRLEAEAGWGFGAFGGRGLVTPFAGLALSEAGERTWRSGVRWTLGPDLAFGVEGKLREAGNDNPGEHEFGFRLTARW